MVSSGLFSQNKIKLSWTIIFPDVRVYSISFWLGSGEYKALPTGPNVAIEKENKVQENIIY